MMFKAQADWQTWLGEHHGMSKGIWMRLAKKSSGIESISYAQALETALCYGWIDEQAQKLDESYWLRKFTPRTSNSIWSQINRAKALELIDRGLMQPAGMAAIGKAKVNGRWDSAYASQKNAAVPADLQRALRENPKASAFFEELKGANSYAIIFRIETAKKPETRAARIMKFVAMLERHEKLIREART